MKWREMTVVHAILMKTTLNPFANDLQHENTLATMSNKSTKLQHCKLITDDNN